MRRWPLAWAAALLLALGACGGGDGGGRTQIIDITPRPPADPPPGTCEGGVLSGVVAAHGPLAAAEVRIVDADGLVARGLTDAQGRYRIELGALQGSLIVQADASDGGVPLRLHALHSADETASGACLRHVTPLTELMAADVMGAPLRPLLARGLADHRRIVRRALDSAQTRLTPLLRPLLDAAGLPEQVDLRGGEFKADGTGLDQVLRLLRIDAMGSRWQVGVIGSGRQQTFDPAAPGGGPLAAPADPAALLQRFAAAQAGVEAGLARLAAAFGAAQLPAAATLSAFLTPDFRHAGLDATTFIERVLLRRDAPADGGFDALGMRIAAVQVIDLRNDGAALARWTFQPRAPFAARDMRMWFQPDASGWKLAGDGGAARVTLRHAVLLTGTGLDDAALQAVPGLSCTADPAAPAGEACRAPSGALGLPVAGVLDLGARGDAAFGLLGLFRAAAGTPTERLQAAAAHSREWTRASSRTERHLLFEVDAREVDARVARVRVSGGALPAAGVLLTPPPLGVNGPLFEQWALEIDAGTDWAALPWGWCDAATPAAECRAAWSSMQNGAVLRFELLASAGELIEAIDMPLPPEPERQALQYDDAVPRMARFDATAPDAFAPTYAEVLALGDTRTMARLRWRPPAAGSTLQLRLHWQRADALGQGGGTVDQYRSIVLDPLAGAPLDLGFALTKGWASTWWSARLDSIAADGLRRIHVIAATNPK